MYIIYHNAVFTYGWDVCLFYRNYNNCWKIKIKTCDRQKKFWSYANSWNILSFISVANDFENAQ